MASAVHNQATRTVTARSTQIGGVHELRATWIDFGEKGNMARKICAAAAKACITSGKLGLEGTWSYREICRTSISRHISIPPSIDRDRLGVFIPTPSQIAGVDQCGAGRIQLGDKRVPANVLIADRSSAEHR